MILTKVLIANTLHMKIEQKNCLFIKKLYLLFLRIQKSEKSKQNFCSKKGQFWFLAITKNWLYIGNQWFINYFQWFITKKSYKSLVILVKIFFFHLHIFSLYIIEKYLSSEKKKS